jgi:hypothetical protein
MIKDVTIPDETRFHAIKLVRQLEMIIEDPERFSSKMNLIYQT